MKIDPNAPAFPVTPTDRAGQCAPTECGLTIRAEIAARVLPLLVVSYSYELAADMAVRHADALIAALNREAV